jgi:hypothetical protein
MLDQLRELLRHAVEQRGESHQPRRVCLHGFGEVGKVGLKRDPSGTQLLD